MVFFLFIFFQSGDKNTGSPSATAGDSDVSHAAPVWPGLSQEHSPTAGTQKQGGQAARTERKHITVRFFLTFALLMCETFFSRKFPGKAPGWHHPLNFSPVDCPSEE